MTLCPTVTPHALPLPAQPAKLVARELLHVATDPYVAVMSLRLDVGFFAGHWTRAVGKPILQAE